MFKFLFQLFYQKILKSKIQDFNIYKTMILKFYKDFFFILHIKYLS